MQNNNEQNKINIDACTSRASCSLSPTISSLEKLAIVLLEQLSFYLLELYNFGARNSKIQEEVLYILASLTAVNEYSENELFTLIKKEYYILDEVKKAHSLYVKKGKKSHNRRFVNLHIDFNISLAQAIAVGEKLTLDTYKRKSSTFINYMSILQMVLQCTCLNLISLRKLTCYEPNIFIHILEILNKLNSDKISISSLRDEINSLALKNLKLQLKLSEALLTFYDGISKVEVSHSTRKGKAILVSGSDFNDLLAILEQTKDKNVDVYTHSNLLLAHSLKRFQRFGNLVGHYGSKTENCILDFATFPGSILLTKNSKNNTEYLYRGRLFSNDYITSKGVIPVIDNDFTSVVEEALLSKGFSKGKIKPTTIIGYDYDFVIDKFLLLVDKLKSNKISHLYILGIDALSEKESAYVESIFDNLNGDEYLISFGYTSDKSNVLVLNTGNYIPLVTSLLDVLFENYSIASDNITFFFTTCDVVSLSSLIAIKKLGANSVFITECSPTMVNPSTFATILRDYRIYLTTTAKQDLQKIRSFKNN